MSPPLEDYAPADGSQRQNPDLSWPESQGRYGDRPGVRSRESEFRERFETGNKPYGDGQTPDEPLEANPIGPDMLIFGAASGGLYGPAKIAGRTVPKLVQAAIRSGTGFGTFGVLDDATKGHNPLPDLPANLLIGGAFGPAAKTGGKLLGKVASPITTPIKKALKGFTDRQKFPGLQALEAKYAKMAAEVRPPEPPKLDAKALQQEMQTWTRPTGPLPTRELGVGTVEAAAQKVQIPVPQHKPFTGADKQQVAKQYVDVINELKNDPNYMNRIDTLGGGRKITNEETLTKALNEGPMSPVELAEWTAEKPINEIIQTRAMMTQDHILSMRTKALREGDQEAFKGWNDMLRYVMPGITNLRATGPRATQAQAMWIHEHAYKLKAEIDHLLASGAPFKQVQELLERREGELAKAEVNKAVGHSAKKVIEAIEMYATWAKLTSAMTHARNTVSNALTWGVIRPVVRTGTAVAYAGQGNLPMAEATIRHLWGSKQGFKIGVRGYIDVLFDRRASATGAAKWLEGRKQIPLPNWAKPLDPFRQLGAADAFWRGITRESEIATRAWASARSAGLKGKAHEARVKQLMKNHPAEWDVKAEQVAKEHTFQDDPDKFLNKIMELRDVVPFGRIILPFLQTPYNIWRFQHQRSIFGLMSGKNLNGILGRHGAEAQAEAFGRLAGGAGITLAVWQMVDDLEITGKYPSDEQTRAHWEANGIKPFSMRIGNSYVNYGRYQPIASYLMNVVAVKEAIEMGDEAGAKEKFLHVVASAAAGISEQPWLESFKAVQDALMNLEGSGVGGGLDAFVESAGSGFVPTGLRDVRNMVDPVDRRANGLGERAMNSIPGLSQQLPEKVDLTGRTITHDTRPWMKDVSPLRGNDVTEGLESQGVRLPRAVQGKQAKLKIAKEWVPLTSDERVQYEKAMGDAISAETRRLMDNETYMSGDTPERNQWREDDMREKLMKVRDKVRAQWKKDIGKKRKEAGPVSMLDQPYVPTAPEVDWDSFAADSSEITDLIAGDKDAWANFSDGKKSSPAQLKALEAKINGVAQIAEDNPAMAAEAMNDGPNPIQAAALIAGVFLNRRALTKLLKDPIMARKAFESWVGKRGSRQLLSGGKANKQDVIDYFTEIIYPDIIKVRPTTLQQRAQAGAEMRMAQLDMALKNPAAYGMTREQAMLAPEWYRLQPGARTGAEHALQPGLTDRALMGGGRGLQDPDVSKGYALFESPGSVMASPATEHPLGHRALRQADESFQRGGSGLVPPVVEGTYNEFLGRSMAWGTGGEMTSIKMGDLLRIGQAVGGSKDPIVALKALGQWAQQRKPIRAINEEMAKIGAVARVELQGGQPTIARNLVTDAQGVPLIGGGKPNTLNQFSDKQFAPGKMMKEGYMMPGAAPLSAKLGPYGYNKAGIPMTSTSPSQNVMDRWDQRMQAIAEGKRDPFATVSPKAGDFEVAEEASRIVGRARGMDPDQVQAGTWVPGKTFWETFRGDTKGQEKMILELKALTQQPTHIEMIDRIMKSGGVQVDGIYAPGRGTFTDLLAKGKFAGGKMMGGEYNPKEFTKRAGDKYRLTPKGEKLFKEYEAFLEAIKGVN